MSNLEDVQENIRLSCEKLGLDQAVYELLKEPKSILGVSIPVKMDDGSMKIFKGYRALHSDALGPAKGGIRFEPGINSSSVKSLAMWMTFRCGVMDIPFGGGKGAVDVNPKDLSPRELEELSRGYIRAIHRMIGENVDIPGVDKGTSPEIMGWMADEYMKITGRTNLGVVTGKPIDFGGSQGLNESIGYGVCLVIQHISRKLHMNLAGSTVAIQGFGNVGNAVYKYLDQLGSKVVALSVSDTILYNEEGINYERLNRYKAKNGSLKGYRGAKEISLEEFWKLPVDILVPSAKENVINREEARLIQASFVAEGADSPISLEAEDILYKKGILVSPDILTNGGGDIASYLEWLQNIQGNYWTGERVVQEQANKTLHAFNNIWDMMEEYEVTLREASYMYAVRKVANVMKIRGWY